MYEELQRRVVIDLCVAQVYEEEQVRPLRMLVLYMLLKSLEKNDLDIY